MIGTSLLLLVWLISGTDPVARINVDGAYVSLTGWGTAFLVFLLIDAAVAASNRD